MRVFSCLRGVENRSGLQVQRILQLARTCPDAIVARVLVADVKMVEQMHILIL